VNMKLLLSNCKSLRNDYYSSSLLLSNSKIIKSNFVCFQPKRALSSASKASSTLAFSSNKKIFASTAASAVLLVTGLIISQRYDNDSNGNNSRGFFGPFIALSDGEKAKQVIYSRAEVAEHNSIEKGVWVTYEGKVYDVTKFIQSHPGGNRILLAAGKDLGPYWNLYKQHKKKTVYDILDQYQIGVLSEAERLQQKQSAGKEDDPYRNEPERFLGLLRVLTTQPLNAESLPQLIPDNYITPPPAHFIRQHHPVPFFKDVEKEYKLEIYCEDKKIATLSLDDIRNKYEKRELMITLQCTGNRRSEYLQCELEPDVQGLRWAAGAISNSKWTGVYLRDVLKDLGLGPNSEILSSNSIEHFKLSTYDDPFEVSIPIDKVLSRDGDVLIAYLMNDELIPPDHGGPLRLIVPGYAAVRSPKWLSKVVASKTPSDGAWQAGVAYKGFPPNVKSFEGLKLSDYTTVQDMPVNSAICLPKEGDAIDPGDETITVQGWAWSGGGRNIVRVDVSATNGETWVTANLKEGKEQPPGRAWAWTFWEAEVPIPRGALAAAEARGESHAQILCRAVDSSFNSQPEREHTLWNVRGLLNNSWYRVNIRLVKPKEE